MSKKLSIRRKTLSNQSVNSIIKARKESSIATHIYSLYKLQKKTKNIETKTALETSQNGKH